MANQYTVRPEHRQSLTAIRHRHRLKSTYGITPEEYDATFAKQDGKCAICRKPESAKYRGRQMRLAVDHNHKTRKNRDLLCRRCNQVVGAVHEDASILRRMAAYVEAHQ